MAVRKTYVARVGSEGSARFSACSLPPHDSATQAEISSAQAALRACVPCPSWLVGSGAEDEWDVSWVWCGVLGPGKGLYGGEILGAEGLHHDDPVSGLHHDDPRLDLASALPSSSSTSVSISTQSPGAGPGPGPPSLDMADRGQNPSIE